MHVYVVIYESAYGDAIDKIFTSSPKAYAYCEEQNKNHPSMGHRIEHYWAI